ncbi:MAG: hypothetical protein WCF19_02610 [Chlamydiales bacterium]
MRTAILALLSIAVCTSGFAQESREARRSRRGQAAGYASRDATVMSMMGWGLGIAVGIAALCALIENNAGSSTSSSSSSGGSGTTTH